MTKIAIISQPEQGVLIDVGGCATLQEATQHLTYTLQVSSQFLEEQHVDLNLGKLNLSREELGQVFSTLAEVGVRPRKVFAQAAGTKSALRSYNIVPAAGKPASLKAAAQTQEVEQPLSEPAAEHELMPPSPPSERETIAVEIEGTICGALPEPPAPALTNVATLTPPSEVEAPIAPVQATVAPGENVAPQEDVATQDNSAAEASTASAEPAQADAAESATAESESGEAPAAKEPSKPAAPHILYIRQNLRSGQAISHRGHLVIIGDVNPGAEVIAEGDITIWGALRGIAHAGVGGNVGAEIRALRFDPIQLRIAHAIARSPDRPRGAQRYNGPETARIVNGTIRISTSTPE